MDSEKNGLSGLINTAPIAAGECHPAGTDGGNTVTMPVELPLVEIGSGNNPAVYLLVCEAAGRIKVGFTRHMETRLRQLGDGCPYPVYPLAIIHTPFYKELEAKIHDDLTDKRVHLEWYELTAEEAMSYLLGNGLLDGDAPQKLTERHCQQCGAAMTGHTSKRYCSHSCKQIAYRNRRAGVTPTNGERYTTMTDTPGASVTKSCDYCGSEFQATRITRRYCNANCRRAAFYQRNPDKAAAKAAARRAELRQRLEARGIAWQERGQP